MGFYFPNSTRSYLFVCVSVFKCELVYVKIYCKKLFQFVCLIMLAADCSSRCCTCRRSSFLLPNIMAYCTPSTHLDHRIMDGNSFQWACEQNSFLFLFFFLIIFVSVSYWHENYLLFLSSFAFKTPPIWCCICKFY